MIDKRHKSGLVEFREIIIVGNFHTDTPPSSYGECPFCGRLSNVAAIGFGFTHKDDCQNPIVLAIREQK